MVAITYLQRALLVPDLQTLSGPEWEACFHRVLFPLLSYLLQPINPKDVIAMEETRMRAATLLSKVFLHHLTPLLSLPTFNNLWLIILDFMDKYMHAEKSDLLYEAIPESLKNMLLVMDSARVFEGVDGKNQLWHATWCRIDTFLPDMKEGLFRRDSPVPESQPDVSIVFVFGGKGRKCGNVVNFCDEKACECSYALNRRFIGYSNIFYIILQSLIEFNLLPQL